MTALSVPARAAPRRRRARRFPVAVVAALALVASACSSGPGTREDFIDELTRDGNLTTEEATCISDAVFARYGTDDEALQKISAAPDFEFLSGAEGVPGFAEFYDETVADCAQVGPTQS